MVTGGRKKPRGTIDIRKIELNCLSRLKKQRAFNSSRKEGRKKPVGCLSVSSWARSKRSGCPVCPVIAFTVQNKWGPV